jgi:hypothetical protein
MPCIRQVRVCLSAVKLAGSPSPPFTLPHPHWSLTYLSLFLPHTLWRPAEVVSEGKPTRNEFFMHPIAVSCQTAFYFLALPTNSRILCSDSLYSIVASGILVP